MFKLVFIAIITLTTVGNGLKIGKPLNCIRPSIPLACANPCGHTCITRGLRCPLYCLEQDPNNPTLYCEPGLLLNDKGCCVKTCPPRPPVLCVKPTIKPYCANRCGATCATNGTNCTYECQFQDPLNPFLICDDGWLLDDNNCCVTQCP